MLCVITSSNNPNNLNNSNSPSSPNNPNNPNNLIIYDGHLCHARFFWSILYAAKKLFYQVFHIFQLSCLVIPGKNLSCTGDGFLPFFA